MKIFNWVHRKFQNKDGYWNEEVKKNFKGEGDDDKVVEVQVPLADAIDSWRHGILTIGTFGFHPLKHFNQLNKEIQLVSVNEEQNEEKYSYVETTCDDDDEINGSSAADDQNPLLLNALTHGDQINGLPHCNVDDLKVNEAEIMFAAATTDGDAAGDDLNDIISYNLKVDDDKKKMKERITLADLFSADQCNFSDEAKDGFVAVNRPTDSTAAAKLIVVQQPDQDVDDHIIIKKLDKEKEACKLLFPNKKLIPPLSQSHPVKKINRMMTKMLKRKIHPQVDEGKNEKKGSQMKNSSDGSNERVSLLQTQDFIAST